MGDPTYFRVKSGSNPHTRNRWGLKKKVITEKAVRQWRHFVDELLELGVYVLTVPPVQKYPGMVFPANAGVVIDRNDVSPFSEKTFLLSNLTPGRSGEDVYYREYFARLGFKIQQSVYKFEGEADFFPAGPYYIFTYGKVMRQRFTFYWSLPPYKRIYGFRTDIRSREILEKLVPHKEILSCELIDERFYHGDTVLCSFGPEFSFLMAYLPAIEKNAREMLKDKFKDKLIELSDKDAHQYAANSIYVETIEGKFLIMPTGVSQRLMDRVKEMKITPVQVNVSEFFEKGGGSLKCMILDLGPVASKPILE